MRVASINSTSPPTGVQASPVATPGSEVRSATSSLPWKRAGRAAGARPARRSRWSISSFFGDLRGNLAADAANFALQVAHAGFAGVRADDGLDGFFGELNLIRQQPVFF